MGNKVKKKVICPECGAKVIDMERHNATTTKHGKTPPTPEETPLPEIEELRVEGIAKLLYQDVVTPLAAAFGKTILPWEKINKKPYYNVAEKIKAL